MSKEDVYTKLKSDIEHLLTKQKEIKGKKDEINEKLNEFKGIISTEGGGGVDDEVDFEGDTLKSKIYKSIKWYVVDHSKGSLDSLDSLDLIDFIYTCIIFSKNLEQWGPDHFIRCNEINQKYKSVGKNILNML